HEPLHAGFVGTGMLDVAVAGAVFASPTALQVLEATKAADAGRGVVQIVKNYTGDVLNFRIAGEISGDDAVETEMVLVDDDLATDTGDGGGPGRRGTAATVIVEKLCGAAAEAGANLAEVAAIGRRAAARARTMSLALSAGTHPGDSEPQFPLGDDEVSSAWASTASGAGTASPSATPTASPSCCSSRCAPSSSCTAATRCSRSSTDWAAPTRSS